MTWINELTTFLSGKPSDCRIIFVVDPHSTNSKLEFTTSLAEANGSTWVRANTQYSIPKQKHEIVFCNAGVSNQVHFLDYTKYGLRRKIPYEWISQLRSGRFFIETHSKCISVRYKVGHLVVFLNAMPDTEVLHPAQYFIIQVMNKEGDYQIQYVRKGKPFPSPHKLDTAKYLISTDE